MFPDDQLLPISALQHLLYCPRQCALIHLERLWAENRFTVEGRHLHAKADKGRGEVRSDVRRGRAVPVWSHTLGLFGVCDVVEFRAVPEFDSKKTTNGTRNIRKSVPLCSEVFHRVRTTESVGPVCPGDLGALPLTGRPSESGNPPGNPQVPTDHPQPATSNSPPATIPFPIEYKRGKPKSHDADRVQLCAQAMCLEEMLGMPVPAGALFYGKTRRRQEVMFDPALRELTRSTAGRLHELIASGRTPAAVYDRKKCDRCSLKHLCLPRMPAGRAGRYLAGALAAVAAGPAGE
jgi:CRISPR/Cas system-associated exonuclease Cas4 (RecB family)